MKTLSLLVLVLAGAALTTQSAVNSQLRGSLHSVMWAVLVSYLVGSLASLGSVKWYQWTGGALGMVYIAAITFSLHRVGAASLFALVVAGQLLTALVYDQFGLLGLSRSSITPARLAGVLFLAVGAYLLNRK